MHSSKLFQTLWQFSLKYFWNSLKLFEIFWNSLKLSEIVFFQILWSLMELSEMLLKLSITVTQFSLWKFSEPLCNFKNLSKTFGNFSLQFLETLWNFLKLLFEKVRKILFQSRWNSLKGSKKYFGTFWISMKLFETLWSSLKLSEPLGNFFFELIRNSLKRFSFWKFLQLSENYLWNSLKLFETL